MLMDLHFQKEVWPPKPPAFDVAARADVASKIMGSRRLNNFLHLCGGGRNCFFSHRTGLFILPWYAVEGILFGFFRPLDFSRDSLCHFPMGKRMVASDSPYRLRDRKWDGGTARPCIPFHWWQGVTVGGVLKTTVSVLRSHTFRIYRWERRPSEL